MMKVLAFLLFMTASAHAQQPQLPPDPGFMQKAINALQQQRNDALDRQAGSEAKASQLAEENAKLKAEMEELRKKIPPVEVEKK
jgi:hypothetical protein